MIGTQVTDTTKVRRVEKHVNKLVRTSETLSVELFAYDFDGYRMEVSTEDTHVAPDDITQITEHTDWSFIGCKDGSVMFEGSPESL